MFIYFIPNKPQFQIGQLLFSELLPAKGLRVARIKLSFDPDFPHAYKFRIFDCKNHPYYTHWISEMELSESPTGSANESELNYSSF